MKTPVYPAYNGGVAFSPDGRFLVWVGQAPADFHGLLGGNILHVYDLHRQAVVNRIPLEQATALADPNYLLSLPCFSSDGATLALADNNWKILLWDWHNQEKRFLLSGHNIGRVSGLAFSPDGRRLASSGYDYRVRLWNAQNGRQIAVFKGSSHCESVAFSPDGERLAWGTESGRVTIIEIATRREIFSFKAHRESVGTLAFSPSAKLIATNDFCGTTKILDAENGRELNVLNSGWSWALRFTPDGKFLSSIGSTTSGPAILMWDLQTTRCTQFTTPPDLPLLNAFQRSAAFSADCKLIAYVGRNYDVTIGKTDDPICIAKPLKGEEGLGRMTPSTDSRTALERLAAAKNTTVSQVKGMPIPTHLAACAVRLKSKCTTRRCVAKIQCACGNDEFLLQYAGRRFEHNGQQRIGAAEFADASCLIVTARCMKCSVEHLLFDLNLHGWNGFVCATPGENRPRPGLEPWACTVCGASRHLARIRLTGEAKADAIEESGGILNEANWQDGFGFVDISVGCCGCRKWILGWVGCETM